MPTLLCLLKSLSTVERVAAAKEVRLSKFTNFCTKLGWERKKASSWYIDVVFALQLYCKSLKWKIQKCFFFPSFFTSNGGVVYCKVTHTSEICAYIERNATTHDGLGFQSFISGLGWILRSIIKIVCTPIVKKILKPKVVSFHYVGAYLWCMQYYYYYYYYI